MYWGSSQANSATGAPGCQRMAPSFSLCTFTRPTGLCRHLSPTPYPSLPTSGTYPSETCLCFQPLGMGVGKVCLGDTATRLLLLSFIMQGLSRDRSYSQLNQTLVWERITHGWKRPSGSGLDHLMSMPSTHPLGQRYPDLLLELVRHQMAGKGPLS